MKISTCVISCVFNDYDLVPPVPSGFDEAILVTDKKVQSEWKNVVLKNDLGAIYKTKLVKMRPDLFTEAKYSVYVDANFRDFNDWLFTDFFLKLGTNEIILFKHPERNNVESEVNVSMKIPKYQHYDLSGQLRYLQSCGFKDDFGLFAGGIIGRVHNENVKSFGNEWLAQNLLYSPQDQVCLPYLLQKYEIKHTTVNEDLWGGPFSWVKHLEPREKGNRSISIFDI
jgi:hypothetical protein